MPVDVDQDDRPAPPAPGTGPALQGVAHAVWQGNDPTTELNYLMVKFPKTAFKTDRVKVTLATNVVPGWNEIDAVQLVGTDQ